MGAYEASAFKALIEEIPKIDAKNQEVNRPLFDIVAGTSIGAIYAANTGKLNLRKIITES